MAIEYPDTFLKTYFREEPISRSRHQRQRPGPFWYYLRGASAKPTGRGSQRLALGLIARPKAFGRSTLHRPRHPSALLLFHCWLVNLSAFGGKGPRFISRPECCSSLVSVRACAGPKGGFRARHHSSSWTRPPPSRAARPAAPHAVLARRTLRRQSPRPAPSSAQDELLREVDARSGVPGSAHAPASTPCAGGGGGGGGAISCSAVNGLPSVPGGGADTRSPAARCSRYVDGLSPQLPNWSILAKLSGMQVI